MRRLVKSGWEFCKAVWWVAGSAAMTIWNPDPFEPISERWPKVVSYLPDISDTQRQLAFAFFTLCLMFWWFHQNRTAWEDKQPAIPDMPLHTVLWHIAGRSKWAVRLPENDDDNWISVTGAELAQALALGRLTAFGRLKRAAGNTSQVRTPIPAEVFEQVEWKLADIGFHTQPPPSHVKKRDGTEEWSRVSFNREQVEAVWPSRPWYWKWCTSTPVDRINFWGGLKQGLPPPYDQYERAQDAKYGETPYLNNLTIEVVQ